MPTREQQEAARRARIGGLATFAAFTGWGLFPIFWKGLDHLPAPELLAQRVIWTLLVALLLITWSGRWPEVRQAIRSRRTILGFVVAAVALGGNWLTFIHAVNTGHVVECSLGYFINPLVSVLLGFLFLGERFRKWQLLAIALACIGVLHLTLNYGKVPWIALVLAGSFGFYGLLRKTAGYEALPGLLLETTVLLAPALVWLLYLGPSSWTPVKAPDALTWTLLPLTGPVTALPLMAFAFGARRIRLATVGFLQYLTPTGMFFLGVFAYREEFTGVHLVTFSCIWAGLVVYSLDAVRDTASRRRNGKPRAPAIPSTTGTLRGRW